MALASGTRLGPYEILGPLGAGGMGEVYRARDPRLKRDVALKVLPPELASEPERLERFQREAESLAALNHPHIVTIHSVEEVDEIRFLTMELVEGKTLNKVIPRGGLPLPRFFRIAIPLTEAVSAAHEKGITHRDLKPGNVMVTEEDRIKVLDFGLAKLREDAEGLMDSQTPTRAATDAGRVIGTAPYMSPEQVQGKAADHRSDVFSLGIMLYEMVTGDRPFRGDTSADLASSILRDTPAPVNERKADLPRDLGRLIKHCLEKEPTRRLQSVLDVRNELEELRREVETGEALTSSGAPITPKRADGRRRAWFVGGTIVAAVALAVGYLLSNRAATPPAEPIKITPFTADGGLKASPRLSPDGEKVAYQWTGPTDDNWDIYVKALGLGTKPLRLTENPAAGLFPAWSSDGRQIAFVRASKAGAAIYTVPSLGGQERKLIDISGLFWAFSDVIAVPVPSWCPNDDSLVFADKATASEPSRIVRLTLSTLEKQPLTSPPQVWLGDLDPSLSPDGTQLAFVRGLFGDFDVWVQPLEGGEAWRVTFEEYEICLGLSWTPDGRELLFTSWTMGGGSSILRVSLAGGDPQPTLGVGQNAANPSIRGNRMVYAQRILPPWDIWRVPGRAASPPERAPARLIASSGSDDTPAYSPDGRRIAFSSNRAGVENIWVCDSDGSNPVQLTSFESPTVLPRWSPDSRQLVFASPEAGDWSIYVIDAEGGVPRRLTPEPSDESTPVWSHDGRWVYFASNRRGRSEIWKIPSKGGQAVQVTRDGGAVPALSWDDRYLYYQKSESPSGIWRVAVDGGEETEVVRELINSWDWALGRTGLYFATYEPILFYYSEKYAIRYLDFESDHVTELYRKEGPILHRFLAVSPDEEWVLFGEQPAPTSELMLVENFR